MRISRIIYCVAGLVWLAVNWGVCAGQTGPSVYGLRCEYKTNPLGIDVRKPRLSWKIVSGERGVRQSAYQIRAGADVEGLKAGKKLRWDSGKVASEQSIHVEYEGPCPVSRERVYWQVREKKKSAHCAFFRTKAFPCILKTAPAAARQGRVSGAGIISNL